MGSNSRTVPDSSGQLAPMQLTTHFNPCMTKNNRYSYWYSNSTRAINGHTRTSKSTDYSLIALGSV